MPSTEVEITEIPDLSAGESALVDLHSIMNVLNVICGELTLLGLALADDADLLKPALNLCDRMRLNLVDPDSSLRDASRIREIIQEIDASVAQEIERRPDRVFHPDVHESVSNLHSVFRVLETRAREVVVRAQSPADWIEFSVEELRRDCHSIFSAIEKNSRGRFRIVYILSQKEPTDYFLNLAIEAANHRTIAMPWSFRDVMRDLMANARKYTQPGGTINAGLVESPQALTLIVTDTGRGIPPEELRTVVAFRKRGSNVGEVRTMGGGFGLTKAFVVTKQFGGRIWIRSELGVGTRIKIEIPRPGRGEADGRRA